MAQRNLLSIVQSLVDSLRLTKVDSIDDTDESLQLANIVRDVYYEGLANRNWPHKETVQGFDPRLDQATHVQIPSDVKSVERVNYNKRKTTDTSDKYKPVEYMTPVDFIDYLNSRNSSDTDVTVVEDVNGVDLNIITDKAPDYWTSLDQGYIIFDSYDSAVDSTIQRSKTQAFVVNTSEFTVSDTFVPDVPEHAFPWLLAESKAVAFIEMAQEGNAKAEQQSRRQQQWLSRKARKTGTGYSYYRAGRVSKKAGK